MPWWPETIRDWQTGAERVRRRPYGVIEIQDQQLAAIHLRPWPKTVSSVQAAWWGPRWHRQISGDRCWLYYNQPLRHRNFLALKYVISCRGTTLASLRAALGVLDEIARLKRSDAILCHVVNDRISDRLLKRAGWEQHLHDSDRRHYIRRFYGSYPPPQLPGLRPYVSCAILAES